jgi:lipopolysaccharide/colanic/teichoic acid biosynthesis glycosyltransferase
MPIAFISHSTPDDSYVAELESFIRSLGYDEVFNDSRSINPDNRFWPEIELGIRRCDIFIVVLTSASTKSEWVMKEIAFADSLHKKVRPVWIEDCDLPPRFADRDVIDFRPSQRGMHGPRQLRPPPADFVGRDEMLQELLSNFELGVNISGLRGQGGVGKTELALKLASLIGERYPDAHIFLDLRGFDPKLPPLARCDVMKHVVKSLKPDAPDEQSEAEWEAMYHTVLAHKRVLLFLDNAKGPEQLLGLTPPPKCALLVTSRQRFSLVGLVACDLEMLPRPAAVVFLRRLAPRLNELQAEEIAERCGDLPLALRLAGALLSIRDDLSVPRYLEMLQATRLTERTGLAEVTSSIRVSEEALPKELHMQWRRLALLDSGFDSAKAAAVWSVDLQAAEDHIWALRRVSLLSRDENTGEFRLHDLIREYAFGGLHQVPVRSPYGKSLRWGLIDAPVAFLLLVFTSPILMLIALLVRLTSSGPALYRQTRVGLDRRPFFIYKFRTSLAWQTLGDPRVTRLGRLLRLTHLDELPQLSNVLNGTMSLIGPRPERPEFVRQLSRAIPLYEIRVLIRPGITGLSQVQLPFDTDLESARVKLANDIYYIWHRNLWIDLRIFAATLCKLFGVPQPLIRRIFCFPDKDAVQKFYRDLSRGGVIRPAEKS